MEIPLGNTREDIKSRRQIIKDFYAGWIAKNPEKKVWNKSLMAYIHVKFQSINETVGHASSSYESTMEVFNLSELLSESVKVKSKPAKTNDRNQRPYSEMVFLYHRNVRLIVGKQRSTGEYVQYCITKKQR